MSGEVTGEDLLAALGRALDRAGVVKPPAGSFTVQQYMAQARRRGYSIQPQTAMRQLRAQVEEGRLDMMQVCLGGRQRYVFWETRRTGEGGQGGTGPNDRKPPA